MAISIKRYVDITSGIGGASLVLTKSLVGRFFTNNALLPPQTFISFTTADEVADYFGPISEEYLRAQFYFSWISKSLTSPQSIQFARFVNSNSSPSIIPVQDNNTVLANWTSITSGSLILTMGGFTFTLSGLDFSAAGAFADIATDLQTAIRAETGGGSMWTGATVTYQSSYQGLNYDGFFLTGGATGSVSNPITVQVGGGGTDITGAGLLGWLPQITIINGNVIDGSIWSTGSALETITQTLTNSSNASNNFGSFAFLTNLNLTLQNVNDAATWNQTQNVSYLYSQAVIPANVGTWASTTSPGVAAIGGIGLTLSPVISTSQNGSVTSASTIMTGLADTSLLVPGMTVSGTDIQAGTIIQSIVSSTSITLSLAASGSTSASFTFTTLQFPEMFPMLIEDATDYTQINAVQNYMYQQIANLNTSVSTDSDANQYDNLNVNYYGSTQQAGQQIAFYQTGVLQGQSVSTNIIDMNAYVNEIWLKDAASVALLNALLVLKQIPANNAGTIQVLVILQSVINQALRNGTISVGKTLTQSQQSFITQETNDPLAWRQVQNNGYWVNVVIQPDPQNPSVYQAIYTLIYSKNDVVRKIIGTHTLI